MNRKRLAITAAVIGAVTAAIGIPVLTGRLPYCRHAYNMEFILQQNAIARDAYFKTHGAPDPSSPDAGMLPPPMWLVDPHSFAFDDRAWITDCSDLVGLLVSVLLGATGAAALSYFGPRLLARLVAGLIALWLRWLRWLRE
jgi:hypothetical protein